VATRKRRTRQTALPPVLGRDVSRRSLPIVFAFGEESVRGESQLIGMETEKDSGPVMPMDTD